MSDFVMRLSTRSIVDAYLASLEEVLIAQGYNKVLEFHNLEGADIIGFRKSGSTVSLEAEEEGEEATVLTVHCEEDNCEAETAARLAAMNAATEVITALLAPLDRVASNECQIKVNECLRPLFLPSKS